MIDAETVGIQGTRIRITGVELGNATAKIGLVGVERKRVKERLHSRYGILSCLKVGDLRQRGFWQPQAEALIGKEKESAVLQNWAA